MRRAASLLAGFDGSAPVAAAGTLTVASLRLYSYTCVSVIYSYTCVSLLCCSCPLIQGSFADIQGSIADILGSFAYIQGFFANIQGSFANI